MPQSNSRLFVHLVFNTKHREPLLHDSIRNDLHTYMSTVLKNMECSALIINSVGDHIHILLDWADDLRQLRNGTRKENIFQMAQNTKPCTKPVLMASGLAAFAMSESNVPAVRQYIQNQREHHQKLTFQEESRTFLPNTKSPLMNTMFGTDR